MYTIIFEDGNKWEGGRLHDSKWNKMPDKPIQALHYKLGQKTIIMENYEAYNHLILNLNFILKKKVRIGHLILMARKGRDVLQLIFDLKTGKLTYHTATYGQEFKNHKILLFRNLKMPGGWKPGIPGKKPQTRIV